MSKSIRIHRTGGPDVLQWEDVTLPVPKEGEVLVRHTAIGVNYIDTYHRSGLYPLALPSGLGLEAAGVVEAIGPGVAHVKVGDRVAYAGGPAGAYAEARVMPAHPLVKISDTVSDDEAASILLQGMTAQYLIRRTYPVKAGDTVLWHAAAGGVGLIACQWLNALGVNVIGTVGSEEKAAIAKAHGCSHTILYRKEDVPARVHEITKGVGVPVVFDSVGKDTWDMSLSCLRPFGLMVSFGNASGAVPPIDLAQLAGKGSLFVTRPILATYTAKRSDLEATAREVFRAVESEQIKVIIGQTYPLRDAAKAHEDLQARRTVGSSLLRP